MRFIYSVMGSTVCFFLKILCALFYGSVPCKPEVGIVTGAFRVSVIVTSHPRDANSLSSFCDVAAGKYKLLAEPLFLFRR